MAVLKHSNYYQIEKNQIVPQIHNSTSDIILNLKLSQNSNHVNVIKKLTVTKFNNLNCGKAEKLKLWSNRKNQIVIKLNSKKKKNIGDKTQIFKLWRKKIENLYGVYTQELKLGQIQIDNMWQISKTVVLLKVKTWLLKKQKQIKFKKNLFLSKSIRTLRFAMLFLWQVTYDRWRITHDMWYVTSGENLKFGPNFRSLSLLTWEWRCFEDFPQKTQKTQLLMRRCL